MKNIHNILSEGGNYYLYDMNKRVFQLIHPEMHNIFSNTYNKSNKCDPYYNKKYKYWKKNGIFREENIKNDIILLDEEIIKKTLIQSPQITFEVTEKCNLKCAYCIYGNIYNNYDCREYKSMDFSIAKNIIDYYFSILNHYNHKNIKLDIGFYGGEPLLNFELIKAIVVYLKKQYKNECKYNFHITTNGVYLNLHYFFLMENNFNILISLDGDEKSSSYRFKNNIYAKVINNIDYIKNNYPDYFKTNINFNAVLHNRNSVDDIKKFFISRYNKLPLITPLNPAGINPLYKNVFSKINTQTNVLNKEENKKLTYLSNLFIKDEKKSKNTFGAYTDFLDLLSERSNIKILPTGTCLPFGKKIYVTTRGKILACERIGHNFPLGNVNNKEVKINFSHIKTIYNNLYTLIHKNNCSKCYLFNRCPVCIFHIENAKCSSFCNKKKFNKYLKDEIDFLELQLENEIQQITQY